MLAGSVLNSFEAKYPRVFFPVSVRCFGKIISNWFIAYCMDGWTMQSYHIKFVVQCHGKIYSYNTLMT